ncbi:MAG TPA: 3-(3-hydroxy-phenyl)propionate transporter MhpT [Gemmatimonadaceae bacterium]|nr:3-(3-hydroxy-phenyl)propionate transporter MhpT [Gemmatimonadaceae bacterium]
MTDKERSLSITIALCFAAALFDGLDIVAPGLVAPQLVSDFTLSPVQMGRLFSSSTVGLLLGALYGGWLADRIGRKRVLIASMITFGLMSLVTAFATTTPVLFIGRVLTGLGLGGALPNLIALSAEAGPPERRTTLVTLMYSGVPLGGAIGGAITLWGGAADNWRILFYVGGIAPLLLAAALTFFLPESRLYQRAKSARVAATESQPSGRFLSVLFGRSVARTTVLLWIAFFCTLLVLYLLVNWLPLLFVNAGYSRPDAAVATIVFNVGGGLGAIALGTMLDRGRKHVVMLASFIGMALSLLALLLAFRSQGVALSIAAAAAFAVGIFVIGTQLALYGIAPNYYATAVRGTGVGAAVAAGRVGSIVGPLVAGSLLGAGGNAASVLTALLPVVAVAAIAALLLLYRPVPIET